MPTSIQSESKLVGQRPFCGVSVFRVPPARNRAAGVTSLACRPCAHLASLDSVERGYFFPETLFLSGLTLGNIDDEAIEISLHLDLTGKT